MSRPYRSMHILTVNQAEKSMKLLNFLLRRLETRATSGEVHRWIRTGQVRVNGKRAHAFDRLAAGDAVRLPPFAGDSARQDAIEVVVLPGEDLGHQLRVLAVTEDFLALEKPAGLPSQPGSKQETDVSTLLRNRFADALYIPAPAHRLDKKTSGILLAGRTHEAQEKLHALFAQHDGRDIEKAYLAWVFGKWPHKDEQVLADFLVKGVDTQTGLERMQPTGREDGKKAKCRVSCLDVRETPLGTASLLRIVLETGRTHQIRVQLAIRNFPIIGDLKYRGIPFPLMLLHAYAVTIPWKGEAVALTSLPPWPESFSVAHVPSVA